MNYERLLHQKEQLLVELGNKLLTFLVLRE